MLSLATAFIVGSYSSYLPSNPYKHHLPSCFTCEEFNSRSGRDHLTFLYFPSGRTVASVKRQLKVKNAWPAGFFAWGRHRGQRVRCGIDTYIVNGRNLIGDRYHRKVIAIYRDGTVKIAPSLPVARSWGRIISGCAGVDCPPYPNYRLMRNLFATKGSHYYHLSYFGSWLGGLWLKYNYGFDAVCHLDGGDSLKTDCQTPCIAAVLSGTF
jgi:hypothetical protein